jgi:hypothetical protein
MKSRSLVATKDLEVFHDPSTVIVSTIRASHYLIAFLYGRNQKGVHPLWRDFELRNRLRLPFFSRSAALFVPAEHDNFQLLSPEDTGVEKRQSTCSHWLAVRQNQMSETEFRFCIGIKPPRELVESHLSTVCSPFKNGDIHTFAAWPIDVVCSTGSLGKVLSELQALSMVTPYLRLNSHGRFSTPCHTVGRLHHLHSWPLN